MENCNEKLLEVRGLRKYFPIKSRLLTSRKTVYVKAVDGIDLDIYKGETLGLVGESGSGKTTAGWTIMQLYKATEGSIKFNGIELTKVERKEMRNVWRNMQMIFQDPYASLNPRMPVGKIIEEPLTLRKEMCTNERREKVNKLMRMVGLNSYYRKSYPHQFSGGQRQRIVIARALALDPIFVICDEAIASLDVSIQAQIVNLLEELKDNLGLTYLFIAHDLRMVRHISDRIAVMYLGRIVEIAEKDELFNNPLHPYTKALISAIPIMNPDSRGKTKRVVLEGDVPSPVNPPSGCRFRTRCPDAAPECKEIDPALTECGCGHYVACTRIE